MEDRHKSEDKQATAEKRPLDPRRRWILRLLEVAQFLIPVMVLAIVATGVLPRFLEITSHRTPKESTHDRLFEYLASGLENNRFDADFVHTGFSHFDRQSDGALTKYGYIETLEDFVVYLNSQEKGTSLTDTNATDSVSQLLAQASETEPFASLPSEERRLMDHIQVLLKSPASGDDLAHALNELKQVLLARHKEYQRIESQNAWSIPLSFVGVILTLVFGVWSLVLAIGRKRMQLQRVYLKRPMFYGGGEITMAEQEDAGDKE